MKFFTQLLFLFSIAPLFGYYQIESVKIDSLINVYENSIETDSIVNAGQLVSEALLHIDRIKAKQYSSNTFPLARVSKDPYLKANGYYLQHLFKKKEILGSDYNEFSYLDSALLVLQNNSAAIDADEAKLLESVIHNSRGVNFSNKGEFEKAIEYYQKSLSIAKELDNSKRIAAANYNIAICHYLLDNYDEAIPRFKELYIYSKENGVVKVEAGSLMLLGSSYQQVDSLYQAKLYVSKAIDLAFLSEDEQNIRESLLTMGLIQEDLNELDSAVFYANKSLEHTLGKEDPSIETQIYLNLARIEGKRSNLDVARENFLKAEKINKKIQRKELGQQLTLVVATIEYEEGDYKSAYELMEKAYIERDSFASIENKKLIKELELQYGKIEDEKLLAEQRLSLAEKQKRITYLSGSFLFSFLGLLIIYAFYQNAKKKASLSQQELDLNRIKLQAIEKEKSILALASTLEGQESERARIAQDLHDGLGGLLSAVKAHYGKIHDEIKKMESLQLFKTAEGMLDNACDEVRRISHNLMPPLLRSQGLPAAFIGLKNTMQSDSLTIRLDVRNMETRLNETQEVFTYRIVQELLSNIVKHANASNVDISLYSVGESIQLIVEDNGKGFDVSDMHNGLGLRSIASRVEYLHGEIDIESEMGEGTSVSIDFPSSS